MIRGGFFGNIIAVVGAKNFPLPNFSRYKNCGKGKFLCAINALRIIMPTYSSNHRGYGKFHCVMATSSADPPWQIKSLYSSRSALSWY